MKAIRLRKLKMPRVNSIFVKLAAFVAIVTVALSATISYEFSQSGMRVAKHQLSKTASQVNTMQADALGAMLQAGDMDAIITAIDFLTAQTEAQMLEAVIVSPDGDVLLDYGVDDTHGKELATLARQAIEDDWEAVSEDGFSVAKTVVNGEDWETIGALATRWTIDAVAAEAWQENMSAIQVAVIVALIAIVLSVLILRFGVSKPMVALSRVVDKVSQEQYNVNVPSAKRGDELGDIGKAVVNLRDQLSAGVARITQNRFRGAAFEASGAAMMMVDDALKITQINRAGVALFTEKHDSFRSVAPDFDPDQMIGYDVAAFHPRLSSSDLSELLSDPKNLPYEDEIGIGELRVRMTVSPVQDEHGGSIGYVVEWMDETEEYLNRTIMRALNESQIRADFSADGVLLGGNSFMLKAWNITEDDLPSMPRLQDVNPRLTEVYHEMHKGNVVFDVFAGPPRGDGEIVMNDGAFAPVLDEQGKLQRIVLIGQDVTDQRLALKAADEQRATMQAAQAKVVSSLQRGLEQLAIGDLTAQIDEAFDTDYEQLRSDYNQALGRLLDAMRGVVENADLIQGEAAEISNAADDLSLRTERQAATLEETASAVDKLTSSVQSAAQGAAHANNIVETARKNAEASGEVVREAVSAMGEIEISSQQIGKITSVIDDIAFQTNLLALNAGVEAARAGEAGRGFAVVASEVRALAQRSSDAAREINELISSSGAQVKRGVDLVDQAGNALRGIVDSVKEIAENVSAIAVSSKEQSSGLVEINEAMNQLDQVTQQNAAMFEETTAASHALTREAETLTQTMSRFQIGHKSEASADVISPGFSTRRSAKATTPSAPPPAPAKTASAAAPQSAASVDDDDGWDEF